MGRVLASEACRYSSARRRLQTASLAKVTPSRTAARITPNYRPTHSNSVTTGKIVDYVIHSDAQLWKIAAHGVGRKCFTGGTLQGLENCEEVRDGGVDEERPAGRGAQRAG